MNESGVVYFLHFRQETIIVLMIKIALGFKYIEENLK